MPGYPVQNAKNLIGATNVFRVPRNMTGKWQCVTEMLLYLSHLWAMGESRPGGVGLAFTPATPLPRSPPPSRTAAPPCQPPTARAVRDLLARTPPGSARRNPLITAGCSVKPGRRVHHTQRLAPPGNPVQRPQARACKLAQHRQPDLARPAPVRLLDRHGAAPTLPERTRPASRPPPEAHGPKQTTRSPRTLTHGNGSTTPGGTAQFRRQSHQAQLHQPILDLHPFSPSTL